MNISYQSALLSNTVKSTKMLQLNVIVLTSVIFAYCESAAILGKISKKCSITDDECVRDLYRDLLHEIADNGIPELGVPKIDPLIIKDTEIVALGMIKITMKEGEAKGYKDCYATSFKSDLTTQRNTIDFVCDRFSLEGSYKIESLPTLMALIGGIDIHGEGNGGVVVENVHLSFDFGFEIKELDDGELHVLLKPDDSTYNFDVKGKATVHADNLLIGKQEISAVAVNIFNENWEFITKTLGKSVVDQAMALFFEQAQVFLTKVPAKELFTDDLCTYVKS